MSASESAVVFTTETLEGVDYRFDGQALPRGAIPLAALTTTISVWLCRWHGKTVATRQAAREASGLVVVFGGRPFAELPAIGPDDLRVLAAMDAGVAWAEREAGALVDAAPSGQWKWGDHDAIPLVDHHDEDERRRLASICNVAARVRWDGFVENAACQADPLAAQPPPFHPTHHPRGVPTVQTITDAEITTLAREAHAVSLAVTGDHGCADDAAREAIAGALHGRTGTWDSESLAWTSDPIDPETLAGQRAAARRTYRIVDVAAPTTLGAEGVVMAARKDGGRAIHPAVELAVRLAVEVLRDDPHLDWDCLRGSFDHARRALEGAPSSPLREALLGTLRAGARVTRPWERWPAGTRGACLGCEAARGEPCASSCPVLPLERDAAGIIRIQWVPFVGRRGSGEVEVVSRVPRISTRRAAVEYYGGRPLIGGRRLVVRQALVVGGGRRFTGQEIRFERRQ